MQLVHYLVIYNFYDSMWIALLPIVILERLLFAVGMVVAHQVLSSVFRAIDGVKVGKNVSKVYLSENC